MKRFERWFGAVALAAAAVALLVSFARDGAWLSGILFAALLLAAAWAVSPFFGGRQEPWASVKDKDGDGGVVIFWRPGCVYCLRLKASLGRSGRRAHWVNIWRDPEAAAFVREHNHGNETVPTVLVRGEVLTNPEPGIVSERWPEGKHRRRQRLAHHAVLLQPYSRTGRLSTMVPAAVRAGGVGRPTAGEHTKGVVPQCRS